MKKKLFFYLGVAVLSLTSCNSDDKPGKKEEDIPFSFAQLDYELAEDVEKEELQGTPWINSNLIGMAQKVEQPSEKDDFYLSTNYDALVNGESGPFDRAQILVNEQIASILSGGQAINNGFISGVMNKVIEGDTSSLRTYIDNIDVVDYVSSKQMFMGRAGLLNIYKDSADSEVYNIQFNDGYVNGGEGYQAMAFYGYYPDYDYIKQAGINSLKYLYTSIGYDEYEANELSVEGMDCTKEYLYVYYQSSSLNQYDYVYQLENDVPYLYEALLDSGLETTSRIYLDDYARVGLYKIYSSIDDSESLNNLKHYINTIELFNHRHLIGLNNYVPISALLGSTQLYANESDMSDFDLNRSKNRLTILLLDELIEKEYIALACSEESKQRVETIISDTISAYKEMIRGVSWLETTSKNKIIKKLNNMKSIALYSDKQKAFPKIDETDIASYTLLDFYNAFYETLFKEYLIGNKETMMSNFHSYTVNAFYSPASNTFVILNGLNGGLLNDSVEITYGTLGTVIGHEISHAFDANGAYYDEKGDYHRNGCWDSEDVREFKAKVKSMSKFYDKINLYDDLYVSGDRVNTESTADMGGVGVMLKLASKIENFDYELFFRSYADLWQETYVDEYLEHINSDTHPYAYLRTNVTLAQFDEFVQTFNIEPGDGMYIPEKQRVKIWK